ncbi:hypothetical protein PE067_10675 [Paracoccus sp. DMF-8]|uniref:hypothetical protein n=1 Tax=Paracoccus sp. DMF-8 TaxID=3019445 RepID=UPI0023E885D9|nr:hypothetical protein [Paracoccus sp. DMF-8]MDF3606565.1 hypothetical protein [Paracoccus sp. DMF-8]
MVDVPSVPPIAETGVWAPTIPALQNGWIPSGGPVNPAADEGLLNWPIQELANRTSYLKAAVDDLRQVADVEVTVGAGGQYASINEALAELSRRRPAFRSGGFTATIRLLSGYVMREQVIVSGVSLGWIEIVSDEPEVLIDRAYLTEMAGERYPAFAAMMGGVLPRISALFSMMATGAAANRAGVMVWGGGFASVSAGAGVKNAGAEGILVTHSGEIFAMNSIFSGAGSHGAHFAGGVSGTVHGADLSGAADRGLFATHGAVVNAVLANCAGSVQGGIRATRGAQVSAISANTQAGTSPSATDIVVAEGGIVFASGAIGGASQATNSVSGSGIIFR